jgi:hypothetical protein
MCDYEHIDSVPLAYILWAVIKYLNDKEIKKEVLFDDLHPRWRML